MKFDHNFGSHLSHIDHTKKEKRRCYGCYKKDEEEMASSNSS